MSAVLNWLSIGPLAWPSPAGLRRNAIAGVVVGIIALPLSIALAVAVGVPPIAGLYTAVFAGCIATVFGGSPYNITGPTAALVPLLAGVVLAHGPQALPIVGLMAGGLIVVMSVFRFGRLIRYMPGMVIVGFTAGIALSIAFGQLNNFLAVSGIDPSLEHFHAKTWDTFTHLDTVRWSTPLVGAGSLALLIATPKVPRLRAIPGPLIAVVVMTAIAWQFGVDTPTVASRYGDLPRDFPKPTLDFFDASLAFDLVQPAVAVAILAAIESLLSAVVADGMSTKPERHDPDRELRGLGFANLVSPIMGGIPATAAIARTAAGIRAGGDSRLTGVFHAATVLTLTLALGGLAGHIPMATLAAILIIVAWNISEAPEVMRFLRRAPREDLMVLVATILITLFFDLSFAIGFGVIISAVLLIRRLVSIPAAEEMLPDATGRVQQVSESLSEMIRHRPDIAFFTAQGMLSFHSAAAFEFELLGHGRNPLILRMKDVHHVDASGLLTLEGIIEHRQKSGGRIILTAIQPDVYPALHRFGIIKTLGPENVFEHTADAIRSIDAPHGHDAHPIMPLVGGF
ncbi:MAG: SulP family inorganic anion transporter [Chloroflexi bacterium]|nr:SulP family inorganic anion transporter [Chloroflexota bacterium]